MRPGTLASLVAALAVALGAFATHALRVRLDPADLALFETGARMHLVHALAAVLAAERAERLPGPWAGRACALFLAGVAVFSGSLYAMALGAPRWLGAVTPVGGVAWLVAWVTLGASFHRRGAGDLPGKG